MTDRTPFHRGGDGEPLVLLHGITMSWHFWRPVLGELQRHHEVFAPTLLGHAGGESWQAGDTVSVPRIADAVCAQLDEQGIDTAHVAGHSLGGWVTLELVRRGRARTAVALSPAGTWRRPIDLRRVVLLFQSLMYLTRRPWMPPPAEAAAQLARHPAMQRAAMHQTMEHGDRVPVEELTGFFADVEGCAMIDDFLGGARADDALPPFDALSCPVRVGWSAHDRILPWSRFGAPLRDKLPGAEFVSLPGCGHVPVWDDPELVLRTILQVTAPDAGWGQSPQVAARPAERSRVGSGARAGVD